LFDSVSNKIGNKNNADFSSFTKEKRGEKGGRRGEEKKKEEEEERKN